MRIDALRKIIQDANRPLKERLAAIKELKEIAPGYNASITKEGQAIEENTDKIDEYLERLKKKAIAEAMYEKIKQSMADAADAKIASQKWEGSIKYQEELLKTNPKLESRIKETWISGGYGPGALMTRETNKLRTQTLNYIEHGKKKLKEANEKRDNALEAVDAYWAYVEQEGVKAEVDNLIVTNGSNGTTPRKGKPVTIKDEKEEAKEAKERKEKIDKYIAEMEQAGRDAAIAYAKGEHEGNVRKLLSTNDTISGNDDSKDPRL